MKEVRGECKKRGEREGMVQNSSNPLQKHNVKTEKSATCLKNPPISAKDQLIPVTTRPAGLQYIAQSEDMKIAWILALYTVSSKIHI